MNASKRILNIEVKRITDEDPDTSYLGQYSNTRDSDYSVDRRHTLDCAINSDTGPIVDRLERVIAYLDGQRIAADTDMSDGGIDTYNALSEAQDIFIGLQDAATDCTCDAYGLISGGGYHYFNSAGNYVGEAAEDRWKYTHQDYERMESLQRGAWYYIGITVEARIEVNGTVQTIASGGLWGIESDSVQTHFADVEAEDLSSLRDTLHGLGFSKRSISAAVKNNLK